MTTVVEIRDGTALTIAVLAAVAELVVTVCSGMACPASDPHSVTNSPSLMAVWRLPSEIAKAGWVLVP